jgi:hypothetical protein
MICPHCWQSIIESDFSHPKSDHESDSKLLCPSCEHDLPENYLSASQHIISILGPECSGKSYFLPVHLKELKDSLYYKYGCFLRRANENTMVVQCMTEEIYERGNPVLMTTLDGYMYQQINGEHYPKPFIYTLKTPSVSQEHNLVFYDQTAMAHQIAYEERKIETKFASGIIFLFDPFKHYAFRRSMLEYSDNTDPQHQMPWTEEDENYSFRYSSMNALNWLKKALLNTPQTNHKKVPIAFVVGKYDAWQGLAQSYFPTSNYFSDPREDSGLNTNAIQNNSNNLRALVGNVDPQIVKDVESLAGSVTYFPLSIFGEPPSCPEGEGFQVPVPMKPFQVDVPMLWMIHRFAPELVSV